MPLYAGFGISTPEQARAAADLADGVVVGSRAVEVAEEGPDALRDLRRAAFARRSIGRVWRRRGDRRVFRASPDQRSPLAVDPPDLGFVATAVRLLRVWREQWRLVLLGSRAPLATTGFALAIPILIRHAIDNSIAPVDGSRDSL